jgi:RHS repeat-associated protein
LGTSTWLIEVSFYDQYYHAIQVRSNNQIKTNVTDHTTNVVNFAGQALEAKQVKTIGDPNGITNTLEITVSTRYEYDDMGRLTKVKQTNPGASELTVAKYEYNPLGQLVDKKLHSTNGTNYLQSVDMRYNIRGQLLSINNSARNINTDNNDESNDVFGMEILYDKDENTGLGNTKYYSGMISAIKWSAASPANTDERSFKYSYDNLYRLTLSKYQAKENGVWTKHLDGFNETLSYDENGNILSLQRSAVLNNSITQIDALTYSYKNTDTHNQLENISDAIPTNTTGYGYRNYTGSSNAYMYDDNGNLTTDPKKGTTITYNELNKPTLIQISSTKKVEYRYDAAGNRISKYIYNNSSTVTKSIEYIGGYVIENDVLSYYSMAEGRVRNEGGGFGLSMKMEYFITDQQGNTRVSFEDNNGTVALIQENSYYAFGMQMAGGYTPSTNPNKKLYNAGSEWQDDIDGLADYYSTFFREYDPVIGRFNGVDPMAEATDEITTYAYANNNPVMMNDPLGLSAARIKKDPIDPGYLLGLEMQRNYFLWHQAQYGSRNRSFWELGLGGSDPEDAGGGPRGGGGGQALKNIIAQSKNRNINSKTGGPSEDLESGTIGKPSDIGLEDYWNKYSDQELFNMMLANFYSATTFASPKLKAIAFALVDRFRTDKSGESVESKGLNNIVANHPKFLSFLDNFKSIFERSLSGGGNIQALIKNPIQITGPVFDDWTTGMGIIIDNCNYTSVSLNSFSIDGRTGMYTANITVHLIDAFGLDKGDVRRFQKNVLNIFSPSLGEGFGAWWLLQHSRGYVPFTINMDIQKTISGTIK